MFQIIQKSMKNRLKMWFKFKLITSNCAKNNSTMIQINVFDILHANQSFRFLCIHDCQTRIWIAWWEINSVFHFVKLHYIYKKKITLHVYNWKRQKSAATLYLVINRLHYQSQNKNIDQISNFLTNIIFTRVRHNWRKERWVNSLMKLINKMWSKDENKIRLCRYKRVHSELWSRDILWQWTSLTPKN